MRASTLTDTFTATTVDGTQQLVTITINGADDAAVISGETTGTVVEAGGVANGTPGIPTDTGDLDADVDDPVAWDAGRLDTGRQRLRQLHAHRSRAVDLHAGQQQCRVQALNAGETLTDTFTAVTTDGTQQLVTITINGRNDAASDQRRRAPGR